jgi:hypothetical protein
LAVGGENRKQRDAAFFYLKTSRAVKNDTARFTPPLRLAAARPDQADFQALALRLRAKLFGTQDFLPLRRNAAAYQEIATCQLCLADLGGKGRSQPSSAKLHRPLKCGIFR